MFISALLAVLLPHAQFTITSALSLDTTTHTVTLPLHRGVEEGHTVWFILTDVSNAAIAKKLGINYAPSLAQLGSGAIQKGTKNADGTFTFAGAPLFKPTRSYVAGPNGFPPKSATPGSKADAAYSPFVTLTNSMSGVVFNAPIVASGDNPSDVTTHTDTEDRVVAIDTKKMTVTLTAARGFFNGKPVYYLSPDASDPVAASVERATYAPNLAKASANGEIPIGVVLDGPQTGDAPQGLEYLALRTPLGQDATLANAATIGAPFNVLASAPDLAHLYTDSGYSPLWNVMVVGAPQKERLTSYAQIAALAKPAGFVVNCPVVAYGDEGY
ncbi:MAG TPA: hypothetical protein VMA98_07415 [Candidatus Acidoferrales bacterium]|nr:hypothetical protein [Candidatus Acidoferrales bacterium]